MDTNSADMLLAAEINARSVSALGIIQGMIAENQKRLSDGMSLAYSEQSFFSVSEDLEGFLAKHNI